MTTKRGGSAKIGQPSGQGVSRKPRQTKFCKPLGGQEFHYSYVNDGSETESAQLPDHNISLHHILCIYTALFVNGATKLSLL